jgi:hypothetical protein
MRPIEDFSNWLTDMDWGWWPLLHLRPKKNQDMDNRLLFKLTPFFGSVAGIIIFAGGCFGRYSVLGFVLCISFGWLVFFLSYKASFAAAWNRRAARLRAAEIQQ